MSAIDKERIDEAVSILRDGGTIVYPTETVYGIGCDPLNYSAYIKIQKLKRRGASKTMLLLADTVERIESFAGPLDPLTARLAEIFWPGPLTIVLTPSNELPDHLLGSSKGVAFRVTPHPVARALIDAFGSPVTSTSANFSNQEPVIEYEDAINKFGHKADLIIPNYEPLHGKPSTVIDVTKGKIALIREGTLSFERIQEVV